MSALDITSYRSHRWLDTSPESLSSREPRFFFGIQGKIRGRRGWLHMAENGKPLLFDTPSEADAWIRNAPKGLITARLATPAPASPSPTDTRDAGRDLREANQ